MLLRIKPAPERERQIEQVAGEIIDRVREEIKKRRVDAEPMLAGSVAKGTYLNDPDIDVFIRFAPSYSRSEIEELGMEIARAVMPHGVAKYAEHPYLHGSIRGFQVDIVPAYRVKSAADKISAVDRTPFHTEYVLEHMEQWQRDHVRLLKAFMKGIGVYGAEAKTQGFSGYLCELLIIKYGSFIETLRRMSMWKKRVYLHLGNGGAEFSAPLVFIDPVDPKRNVASAVSEESKSKATLAAKMFLNAPSTRYFFPEKPEVMNRDDIEESIRNRGTVFLCIEFPAPRDMVEDMLFPQMYRTLRAFMAILSEFMPVHGNAYLSAERVWFVMEFERGMLPGVERHAGPPVWTENAVEFMNRWTGNSLSGPYISGNRLYVDRKRDMREITEALSKGLRNHNLGKYFEKNKDKMVVHIYPDCLGKIDEKIISGFLKRKFTWI